MSRRARGFTLLEIAVALAILGIGMVACIQAFGGGLRLVDRAVRQDRAVQYARAKMDRLIENARKDKGSEDLGDGYRVSWLVRDADASDGVELPETDDLEDVVLRYLEVDVTWQDGVGEKSYALRTLQLRNLEQEEE
jgi:prepilin-type N-terminal cleavage/methylation domain-containing protein